MRYIGKSKTGGKVYVKGIDLRASAFMKGGTMYCPMCVEGLGLSDAELRQWKPIYNNPQEPDLAIGQNDRCDGCNRPYKNW